MLRTIIRYLLIQTYSFIYGLSIILFDKDEIIDINFIVEEKYNPKEIEQAILRDYLTRCYKQVHKKDNK